MSARSRAAAVLALLALVAVATPALAAGPAADGPSASAAANGSVEVGTGQQISTVAVRTSAETRTEIERAEMAYEYETSAGENRSATLAERARTLSNRSERILADYRQVTAALRAGNVSETRYARRVALLSARASSVRSLGGQLLTNESALAAAGVNVTAFRADMTALQAVTGPGSRAILATFSGEGEGEIEVRTAGGVSVEVERDGGESSREVRRSRDEDPGFTVSMANASVTARNALSTGVGNWTLVESSVHEDSGYYEFEYTLRAPNRTGEAEVRVDGTSGDVFRVEEAIEPLDDEDDEAESDRPLRLALVAGDPAPGATVTVRATRDGAPVAGAEVEVAGDVVGTTGEDGRLSVTIPAGVEEVRIRVDDGEDTDRLEYEFEPEDGETPGEETEDEETETESGETPEDGAESEDDEPTDTPTATDVPEMDLAVVEGTPAANATITVRATRGDSPVADATVELNGEVVGRTGEDGRITVTLPAEEARIRVEDEEGHAELEWEFAD